MLENRFTAGAVDSTAVLPRVWAPPGVYQPQEDSRLIAQALTDIPMREGLTVLDLCTGSGVLAMAAAQLGASHVVAVDISLLAVLTAWTNARLRRLPVTVRRGDLQFAKSLGAFDVVVANPPYVPALSGQPSSWNAQRWDAGDDGRAVLDPLCEAGPELVRPDGSLILIHSGFSDECKTIRMLNDRGFDATIVARTRIPFGPVLRSRRIYLESRGLCEPGCDSEELVVIRADRQQLQS